MNARVLASIVAALAMFGSLPLWWWLHQKQASLDDGAIPAVAAEPAAPSPATGQPDAESVATAAPSPGEAPPVAPEPAAVAEPSRPDKAMPELVTGPDSGRSPIADHLNADDGSIGQDLAIVEKLLDNYLLQFGSNPVGSNREITAQLSGHNPKHHAPLARDVSAISGDGQLIDRWGTPFFFHALSARAMEIRSAGPDRELYTEDDALLSPTPRAEMLAGQR